MFHTVMLSSTLKCENSNTNDSGDLLNSCRLVQTSYFLAALDFNQKMISFPFTAQLKSIPGIYDFTNLDSYLLIAVLSA